MTTFGLFEGGWTWEQAVKLSRGGGGGSGGRRFGTGVPYAGLEGGGQVDNAERQRRYRERKRNATGVTERNGEVPVTDVTRNAETVTALRARVEELEGEVGRLKRELSGRAAAEATKLLAAPGDLVPALERSLEVVREKRDRKAAFEAGKRGRLEGQVVAHGARCACLGCRGQGA